MSSRPNYTPSSALPWTPDGPTREQLKCTLASGRKEVFPPPPSCHIIKVSQAVLCTSPELRLEEKNHFPQSQEDTGERSDLNPPSGGISFPQKPPIFSLSFALSLAPSLPLPLSLAFRHLPHHNHGSRGEMFASSILSRRDIGDRFGSD